MTAVFTADALEHWRAEDGNANCLGSLAIAVAHSQKHTFAKTRGAGSPEADDLGTHSHGHHHHITVTLRHQCVYVVRVLV